MEKNLRNKLTYHRRLFIGLVTYSLVLMGCFAIFQYHREREFKVEELNLQLQALNDRILDELRDTDFERIRDISIPSVPSELRVSVIDLGGNVKYDNTLDTLPGSNHLSRKEIADAMTTGEGFTLRRHSESTGETYFYSATKKGDYIVRTAIPYNVTLHQLLSADYGFLWFMTGITVIMCIIGYFATRRVGQHVARLNRFAEKAERGERIFDTEPFPHDELGEISNHIVRLYASLQQAISDRDREHKAAIYEEQEKIRIKRQLTNNINHEIKTPVAAMQVCLETLLAHPDMSEEKRRMFVERCLKANNRLKLLLSDVSSITRLEDGGESIARENVNLAEVAAEVCDEFEVQALNKGFTVINGIDCDSPMEGNGSLMASVFRNLIGNALAYSGGDRIELRQNVDETSITITVTDNGTGVAEEHLPRLFERFYRVDKGRSRQMGGTGLGLAIVKNAVLWHGGTVAVRNRPSGGLEVEMRFIKT